MKVEKYRIPLMLLSLFLVVSAVVVYLCLNPQEPNHRFFTNLSNLFMGLCGSILFICLIPNRVPRWVVLLQFIGTNNLFLTMMTVILFLAPMQAVQGGSYLFLFEGTMLFYHLIDPLAAILLFVFLLRLYRLRMAETLLTLVPVSLYAAVYMSMVLSGRWPDFYGFTFGGRNELIPIVLIVMGGASFGLASLLRVLHNHFVTGDCESRTA